MATAKLLHFRAIQVFACHMILQQLSIASPKDDDAAPLHMAARHSHTIGRPVKIATANNPASQPFSTVGDIVRLRPVRFQKSPREPGWAATSASPACRPSAERISSCQPSHRHIMHVVCIFLAERLNAEGVRLGSPADTTGGGWV